MFYVDLKRMCILFCGDVMSWRYQLSVNVLLYHLGSLLPFLSQRCVHWCWVGCLSLLLLLYSYQFLPFYVIYVFGCSYIGCIHVDKCNILSLYWSIYHCIVSFFFFVYSLCFKVCFVWYKYCYPCFLVIPIFMK